MSSRDQAQSTIFLLEEDDDTRPLLRRNLEAEGYRVIVAVDERDALERVEGGHVAADLVLVNLVGTTPQEALVVGRNVRVRANYGDRTPLVVMAEKYGADLEGTDANVEGSDWITYPEDAEQLRALLRRLLLG
ncbi:MAG: hypothetical protein ACJ741_05605 [Pyrinomonadaceae bacterium]